MPFSIQLPSADAAAGVTLSDSGASSRGSHQLMAASGCDRKFALKYIAGMRTIHEPPYRLVGTLIHECLAHHYAGKLEIPPNWYKPGSLEESLQRQGAAQPEQVQTAREVYAYYRSHMASESLTPLFVEEEFSATIGELDPLPEGVEDPLKNERVTCRTDLVCKVNGKVYVLDHKCSAGGWGKDRLDRWQEDGEYKMSFQAMMNLHILSHRLPELGHPAPTGFIVQRIKRKAPFDVDRNIIKLSPLAMEDAPRTARHLVSRELEIRNLVKIGQKPAPNFAQCWGRYGKCDYHAVCSANSAAEKNMLLNGNFVQTK